MLIGIIINNMCILVLTHQQNSINICILEYIYKNAVNIYIIFTSHDNIFLYLF